MVLRKEGAIRSQSPWPPAEPWPERPVAKSEKFAALVETAGHVSVRVLGRLNQRLNKRFFAAAGASSRSSA